MVVAKRILYPITAVMICFFIGMLFYFSSIVYIPNNNYFLNTTFSCTSEKNNDFVIRKDNYFKCKNTKFVDEKYSKIEFDGNKLFVEDGIFCGAKAVDKNNDTSYLLLFTPWEIDTTFIVYTIDNFNNDTKVFSGFDNNFYFINQDSSFYYYDVLTNEASGNNFGEIDYHYPKDVHFVKNDDKSLSFSIENIPYIFRPSDMAKETYDIFAKWYFNPYKITYFPFDNIVAITYFENSEYYLVFKYDLNSGEINLSLAGEVEYKELNSIELFPVHKIKAKIVDSLELEI